MIGFIRLCMWKWTFCWSLILISFANMWLLLSWITKGQLISEWIFGVFKSPKKPTKFLTDFCPMKLGQKSVKYLVGFLGDLKTAKIHSEINWPLNQKLIEFYFMISIFPFLSIFFPEKIIPSVLNMRSKFCYACWFFQYFFFLLLRLQFILPSAMKHQSRMSFLII